MAFLRVRDVEKMVFSLLSIEELIQLAKVNRYCRAKIQAEPDYLEAKKLWQMRGQLHTCFDNRRWGNRVEPQNQVLDRTPLRILKFLYRNLVLINLHWVHWAASAGRLDFTQWLNSIEPITNWSNHFPDVCGSGNLAFAQWVYVNAANLDLTKYENLAFHYACRSNNVEMVEWLWLDAQRKGTPIGVNDWSLDLAIPAIYLAIRHNQLEIAQWLYSKGGRTGCIPELYQRCLKKDWLPMAEFLRTTFHPPR